MLEYNHLYILSFIFFLIFLIREYSAFKGNLPLKYFFTPSITLVLVLMMILSIGIYEINRYRLLILLSLLMALVADTMLMIEEIDLLKNGMVFFILSHIFYIVAFSDGISFKTWNLILLAVLSVINFFYLRLIRRTADRMFIFIVIYSILLNAMLYFAVIRINNEISVSVILASAGAALFMVSDLFLSINAFVRKIPHSTVYTWLLYAPAQFLIVLSTFKFN